MRTFQQYQNVKTGRWISYNKAQKLHLKIKGFTGDFKRSKIFVPPPTSRLIFREKSSGRFLNKYKTLHKKISPELYIEGVRRGKVLPREYSETELKLIIAKFKGVAKRAKIKGEKIPEVGMGIPPREPGRQFLETMIEKNRERSYKKIKQVIVDSYVDYIPKKTFMSKERELRIKDNMLQFILDLPREDQKNITIEQLKDIYEMAKEEIKDSDSQTHIPF